MAELPGNVHEKIDDLQRSQVKMHWIGLLNGLYLRHQC